MPRSSRATFRGVRRGGAPARRPWLPVPAARRHQPRLPQRPAAARGLVTTKRRALESKDELKRRIDEASKHVPLDQLCLLPQCGFSSTVEGNVLTYDEEAAKLQLVVETAREVWG